MLKSLSILTCLLSIILLVSAQFSQAQSGCTDPNATNFNSTATINDGSCTYPSTSYSLSTVATLSETLAEISGMTFTPNRELWALNDGGNGSFLYQLDTMTGIIMRTVFVDVPNQDWESLTSDDSHLYIGEIGNNDGDRTDLSIYKIALADLANDTVHSVDTIEFSYPRPNRLHSK